MKEFITQKHLVSNQPQNLMTHQMSIALHDDKSNADHSNNNNDTSDKSALNVYACITTCNTNHNIS